MSAKQIAAALQVGLSDVDTHCAQLMSKLEIGDRAELARFAIRQGSTPP